LINVQTKTPITKNSKFKPISPDLHADPSARVFKDRLYVYVSNDTEGARNWSKMVNWSVLSTDDMVSWKDHGIIFDLDDITWADKEAWAPDCIELDGKYYFYFPAAANIGVAVSDSPEGPFTDLLKRPLIERSEAGIDWPIDPCAFIDDDGQAYLYFGGAYKAAIVKLKSDMVTRDGPIQLLDIPQYYEGIWIHKRQDTYYASYPCRPEGSDANKMLYSTAPTPFGPWTLRREILDNHSHNIHGSITSFKNRDYVFFHIQGPSRWERKVCVEEISYSKDGKISLTEKL
jgi:arabinoxylan arabinofuranohydrolase